MIGVDLDDLDEANWRLGAEYMLYYAIKHQYVAVSGFQTG